MTRAPEHGHAKQCLAYALISAVQNVRDDENVTDHEFRLTAQDGFLPIAAGHLADGLQTCTCPVLIQIHAEYVTARDAERQIEARNGVDEIDDATAVTIASWWQSPGSVGSVLAGLASGATVEHQALMDDIAATRRQQLRDAGFLTFTDRMALDMLSTWAIQRTSNGTRDYTPIVPAVMRYASVCFLQGDDANHALELIDAEGEQAALEYLSQWHQDTDPYAFQMYDEPPHGTDDDVFSDGPYVMSYSQRLGYAGLALRFPSGEES